MSKSSQFDPDLLKAIADLVNESNLAEIEIEKEDFRVRVTRSFASSAVQPAIMAAPAAPAPAAPAAAPASVVAPAPAADDISSHPGTLTSPMVGTVYLAPEPGAPNFVAIGDNVTEGQTVLIVEAMKTMNQIPAHKSGKLTQILVENEHPIEYGEPLLIIE